MNIYRILKGLDEMVKEWPRLKKSLKQLTAKSKDIETSVKELKRRPGFQDRWDVQTMPGTQPTRPTIGSLCKQEDLLQADFAKWCAFIKKEPAFHRKLWEFVYIIKSLHARGQLAAGKRGLGFAVGTEPLPAAFASLGCTIVATDIEPEIGEGKGWDNGNQLCRGVEDLNREGICPSDEFRARCSYRAVDMNFIPDDLRDFDFTWSSCSFEHLGSIEKGLAFVRNQMKTL